ncbi:nuclear transport factor 2 family protein [Pseudonocardia nigra]|uniref:nuclear transport factor 2 family protein n=1 Tax=Pseudonocardia nigra TaxID=1921578 RepID=UPI001C5E5E75|nr:nuclear transport factor 2 family protein [Pseudonocardia nigra]
MTAAENVRRIYQGLDTGDAAELTAALTPDAVLHVPGNHPLSGRYDGPDAILGFLAASRSAAASGEHIEVLEVLTGHKHVAVYARSRAERGGAVLDNPTVHLLRMVGDRIAEVWFHNREQQPVDTFWSGGVR